MAIGLIHNHLVTMMKALVISIAAMVVAGSLAYAQGKVEVTDNIVFTTNDATDGSQSLAYGFGTDYTDSTDFAKGEQIIPPFFPPDGFYVFFAKSDGHGSEDFYVRDIRGVPDSVKNNGVQHFSQMYLIRIQRYRGQNVTISLPFPLLRGIDSLVFESTQAGANFRAVFTERGSVLIPNEFIRTLRFTAYYNYERAAAVPGTPTPGVGTLAAVPNPVRAGSMLRLQGAMPANARIAISDLHGSIVRSMVVAEPQTQASVELAGLAAGLYMARIVDPSGAVIGQTQFVTQ